VTRNDTALVAAASAGDRNAFAALVARTAPDVAASLPASGDHHDGLHAVYTAAMRELYDGATPTDVNAWLLQLVKTGQRQVNQRRQTSAQPSTLDPDLDRLWGDLAPLWPRGRKPYVRLSRRTQIASVGVVLLLGALYALIQFQSPRLEEGTLIATVYQSADDNRPTIDNPPTDSETITVPVIPLPPLSADERRPQQPSPPAPSDDTPTEPVDQNDTDEPSDEPSDEPDTEGPEEPEEPEEPTSEL